MLYMLYSIYLSSFFLPSCLSKIIKVLRKSFCVQLLIERCELREFCESSVLEICHSLRWMQEGRRDSEGVGGGRGLKQTMLCLKRATAKQTNELASKTIACSMLLGAKPAQHPLALFLLLPLHHQYITTCHNCSLIKSFCRAQAAGRQPQPTVLISSSSSSSSSSCSSSSSTSCSSLYHHPHPSPVSYSSCASL